MRTRRHFCTVLENLILGEILKQLLVKIRIGDELMILVGDEHDKQGLTVCVDCQKKK